MPHKTKTVIAGILITIVILIACGIFYYYRVLSDNAQKENNGNGYLDTPIKNEAETISAAEPTGTETPEGITNDLPEENKTLANAADVSATTAPERKPGEELTEGDLAPDFSIQLLSGDEFTLSEYKGTVVFLNFGATWCSPCVAEMPAIQTLSEQYADQVFFLGIDIDEDKKKVREFIDKNNYTYNIAVDENSLSKKLTRTLYPTQGIPYTLIIDADGVITSIYLGGSDQMHDLFEESIKKALGE